MHGEAASLPCLCAAVAGRGVIGKIKFGGMPKSKMENGKCAASPFPPSLPRRRARRSCLHCSLVLLQQSDGRGSSLPDQGIKFFGSGMRINQQTHSVQIRSCKRFSESFQVVLVLELYCCQCQGSKLSTKPHLQRISQIVARERESAFDHGKLDRTSGT